MKHENAKYLHAHANGEVIEAARYGMDNWHSVRSVYWRDTNPTWGCPLEDLWDGLSANWRFRIKPKTIQIGDAKCEMPILQWDDSDQYFYWDSVNNRPQELPASRREACQDWLEQGRIFGSAKACEAAHHAVISLLTQRTATQAAKGVSDAT